MKTVKRTVAALLATLMLATSTSFTLAAENYTDKEAVVVAKVNAAGIMQGKDTGFAPEDTLTRAEAAAIMVRMKGISESSVKTSAGTTLFNDVAASHWAAGYINVASTLGIINGVGNGMFAPDRTVTIAEFETMAIRALGAGQMVDAQGVWPINYVNFANEEDISKDVYAVYTAEATRMNAATIVANTIEAPMWVKSKVTTNKEITWEKTGVGVGVLEQTIVKDVLKLDEDEEVIVEVSNNDSTVTDSTGKTWDVNPAFKLSGIKTGLSYTFWYNHEDEEVQGLWIDDADTVEFTEIVKVTSSKVTLMIDGKEKEFKYDTTGTEALQYTVNEVSGRTIQKNANAFGTAYVDGGKVLNIFATDYTNYEIVDEVKSTKVSFVSMDVTGDSADSAIITNNENNEYFLTKNGRAIDFDDLKSGDAIAYYTKTISGGKKYVIEVVSDSIEGKVTNLGTGFVKVDRVKYDTALGMRIDEEIEAWLNHAGDIVMFRRIKDAASDTAIITKLDDKTSAYVTGSLNYDVRVTLAYTDGTKSDELTIDLEDTFDEIKEAYDNFGIKGDKSAYTLDSSAGTPTYVAFDDVATVSDTDLEKLTSADKKAIARTYVKDYMAAGKVVCYNVNGSKMTLVPTDATEPEVIPAAGTLTIGKNSSYLTVAAFDYGTTRGITKVYVDENTKFFKLKADGSKVKVEELAFSDLDDDSTLGAGSSLMGFDEDERSAQFVVFSQTGSTVKRVKETNFAFVEELTTAKENGKTITTVNVIYTDGKKAELIANSDTTYTNGATLRRGDVYDLTVSGDYIVDVDDLNDNSANDADDEIGYMTITNGGVHEWLAARRDLTLEDGNSASVSADVLVLEYDADSDEFTVRDMDALNEWDSNAVTNTVVGKVALYCEEYNANPLLKVEDVVVLVYEVVDREALAPIAANISVVAGSATGETKITALVNGLEYSVDAGANYTALTKDTAETISPSVGDKIYFRVKATNYTLASDDLIVTVTAAMIK